MIYLNYSCHPYSSHCNNNKQEAKNKKVDDDPASKLFSLFVTSLFDNPHKALVFKDADFSIRLRFIPTEQSNSVSNATGHISKLAISASNLYHIFYCLSTTTKQIGLQHFVGSLSWDTNVSSQRSRRRIRSKLLQEYSKLVHFRINVQQNLSSVTNHD